MNKKPQKPYDLAVMEVCENAILEKLSSTEFFNKVRGHSPAILHLDVFHTVRNTFIGLKRQRTRLTELKKYKNGGKK